MLRGAALFSLSAGRPTVFRGAAAFSRQTKLDSPGAERVDLSRVRVRQHGRKESGGGRKAGRAGDAGDDCLFVIQRFEEGPSVRVEAVLTAMTRATVYPSNTAGEVHIAVRVGDESRGTEWPSASSATLSVAATQDRTRSCWL